MPNHFPQVLATPGDTPLTNRRTDDAELLFRNAHTRRPVRRNPLSEHDIPFFGGNQILVFLGVRATSAALSMLYALADGLVYVSPPQNGVTPMKQCDRRFDVGLPGLVDLLIKTRGASLASLPQTFLDTLSNQAANVRAAAVGGLGALADLVSGHSPQYAQLDHVGVGWLLHTLHDLLIVAEGLREEVSGAAANGLAATITKERQ